MFESLDGEEAARVRPWRAPRLGGDAAPLRAARAGAEVPSARAAAALLDALAEEGGTADREGAPVATEAGGGRDAVRTAAFAEGHAAGYAEGLAAGRATGRAEGMAAAGGETAAAAAALIDAIARERRGLDARLEEEVLALVHTIARLVLRRELAEDAEALARLVRRALAALPQLGSAPAEVRLAPEDAEMLAAHADALDGATLVADARLARGDCRIRAGAAEIDAGADAWVDAVVRGQDP